jgi:hypothetical protein
MRALLPIITLAACSEQGLISHVDDGDPGDSDTDAVVTETDVGVCDLDLAPAGDVDVRAECEAFDPGQVENPWDFSVEWETNDGAGSVVMPAVGNLSDDNGDGVIDDDDIPDVAYVGYGYGGSSTLYVHSGDGSARLWTASNFRGDAGVAIADIDSDGINDVVGITPDGRVIALDNTGAPKWTSRDAFAMLYPVTTVADLDGDGHPEVIADMAVVNGEDGSTVASLASDGYTWRTPVVADLDLDGYQEILLAQNVYDSDGTVAWSASGGSGSSCFDAVYQGDNDDEAEIAFAWGPELLLYEHDGTLIDAIPIPSGGGYYSYYLHPGPPCVGDINGDGDAEIVVPASTAITAFETDGTVLWSSPMSDFSGAAGCSVYDMDGDDVYEVVFADEQDLRVYDGRTGTVLYTNGAHESVTYFEYPVIADVDHDGSAEILVSSSTSRGVTVFGHNGSGWPAAGPTWGIHDYAFTNQGADGSVPSAPIPSWLAYNVFRGRPSSDQGGTPDLLVAITDVCVTECADGGPVRVAWQVRNEGAEDVPAGVPLTVYVDGVALQTITLPAVPSGRAIAGDELQIAAADLGSGSIRLVVDDDGSGRGFLVECDETNNAARRADVTCAP